MLEQITLTAIIRDELVNPAGGIELFIRHHLPHYPATIIADTGSKDGTRDKLTELEKEYDTLIIIDTPFTTYAKARNSIFPYVQTEKVQVLDADECIKKQDLKKLAKFVKKHPAWGYWFNMKKVHPGNVIMDGGLHNPRLFSLSRNAAYKSANEQQPSGEWLYAETPGTSGMTRTNEWIYSQGPAIARKSPVPIYHFMPTPEGKEIKREWYQRYRGELLQGKAPSELPGFNEWKKISPAREKYR